uniref:putative short-chain dehydrogenase/reductase family 42E member 2 n=1 Tax=Doryrhamphus excisus TaxID=161450 RepID=UPI0025ADEBDD|nr:putative short-chain dehydrogenase/reductase family 42E member 2 [Doryrhamphus excisus]XP_057905310.1 putative short-chain dehydrogenase/reductase family 42E member 2 [Doryrhamphus excisus]XP_057905311.1 putative short-chain dehydrogenase/reductase family 42E member 2 [Doryrhamphus excisus]XP_057905312.1 putative short-chain dehydrogenase/reductase family 42E member 2 [Doryrhamphus excisus]
MELCGPNMSESGGSLCHGVSLCRLQVSGQALHNLSPLTSRVKHAPPALRQRVNGAMASTYSSPECATSKVGESGSSAGKVLVTGGGGYFGFRLGRALASQGMSVILLDMNKPPNDIPDGAVFYQNDIRDYSSLFDLCDGVDCVFHSASYGMSGPEQLRKEQVESVNVGGTNNVINVCKERSIPRLVYTSTINTVFAGEPIEDGDEASVPFVPPCMHVDHYSRTKAVAEQMVLSANGCSLKGGGLLRTCVLRPCGIYGPEERRHLHRVMVNVERRFFSFRFGNPQARMNWVHVDNLVLAHALAAEALTMKKSCIASGQVYFINDGLSVNLFEWLTPLFEKLGYSRPLITLPFCLVYSAAILVEYLHIFLRPVIEVPLLFTRNEVRNIAVSHTFKIDKARQDLGYSPKSYSLVDSVEQYLHSRKGRSGSTLVHWRPPRLHRPHMVLLLMAFSMLLLMLSCVQGSILT